VELELSYKTWYLLAQHLHWVTQGYDTNKIKETIKLIRYTNPFSSIKLHQIAERLGIPASNQFKIEELEKLTYFYSCQTTFDFSVLKFCNNLEEIDIRCLKLDNLDFLSSNLKLKEIKADNNNISNLEPLGLLKKLENLEIEDNVSCSLSPLVNLKNLKNINIGLIDDEADALNIIKDNPNCTINYLIKGIDDDFINLNLSYYWIIIKKTGGVLSLFIEGVDEPNKYQSKYFPEELFDNVDFNQKLLEKVKFEVTFRLEEIVDFPVVLNLEKLIYDRRCFMVEYEHEI
jgi:hypothetical protein